MSVFGIIILGIGVESICRVSPTMCFGGGEGGLLVLVAESASNSRCGALELRETRAPTVSSFAML